MAVIHKNLPDSQLHESKGVAGAVADQVYVTDGAGSGTFKPYDKEFSAFETADSGKVYVSDGAGSGLLQPYDKEPKGITTASADQVYVANGAGSGSWEDYYTPTPPAYASLLTQGSSITLTAATDTTLATDSEYVPLNNTSMWTAEAANNVSSSASSGQFTITSTGTYKISFSGSIQTGVASNVGLIFGDGTGYYTKRTVIGAGTAGTTISASTVVSAAANDVIGAFIACGSAETVTLNTATFMVERLS